MKTHTTAVPKISLARAVRDLVECEKSYNENEKHYEALVACNMHRSALVTLQRMEACKFIAQKCRNRIALG